MLVGVRHCATSIELDVTHLHSYHLSHKLKSSCCHDADYTLGGPQPDTGRCNIDFRGLSLVVSVDVLFL